MRTIKKHLKKDIYLQKKDKLNLTTKFRTKHWVEIKDDSR